MTTSLKKSYRVALCATHELLGEDLKQLQVVSNVCQSFMWRKQNAQTLLLFLFWSPTLSVFAVWISTAATNRSIHLSSNVIFAAGEERDDEWGEKERKKKKARFFFIMVYTKLRILHRNAERVRLYYISDAHAKERKAEKKNWNEKKKTIVKVIIIIKPYLCFSMCITCS